MIDSVCIYIIMEMKINLFMLVTAKALQIDSSAIAKCCRHVPKYKRAGGYVWEYKENYGD